MRKKIRSRAGFTLIETLFSVVVLLLLALSISAGTAVSTKAYRQSVFESRSEVLQSTINSALSDITRFAGYTGTDANGNACFVNSSYHILPGGHFVNRDGRIYINAGAPENDDATPSTLSLLINSGAYTTLSVKDLAVSYDPVEKVFSGTYTIWVEESELTKQCDFQYKTLA